MKRRAFASSVVGAMAVIGLAACGYGDDSPDPAPVVEQPAAPVAPASIADVSTLSTSIGTVMVNAAGRTLYAFDNDQVNPSESTCYGDCAAAWPPVPATTNVEGIDAGLIGSVTRDDGAEQLTINDNPVYLFANDAAPGDTRGQGVNDVWHALSPYGDKL